LHKSEQDIERVVKELAVGGYISIQLEKKTLTINVPLLKQSFSLITSQEEEFAQSFYQRLFSYYPETLQLFAHTDMKRQGSSLMATLVAVISGAERGENLIPILHKLGAKHYRYGAKAEHYPLVGSVLLETFYEYLGPRFTIAMQDAWNQAYELISEQMMAPNE
jgi:methyl-accepting chemotaxis protein